MENWVILTFEKQLSIDKIFLQYMRLRWTRFLAISLCVLLTAAAFLRLLTQVGFS
mgnify:CR=1 FL=1